MDQGLFDRLGESSPSVKVMLIAVATVWSLVLIALVVGGVLFLEKPGQALEPTPGAGVPVIRLDPAAGPSGTTLLVSGEGWTPGELVLIYLVPPGQAQPSSYAQAGATAGAEGRFTVRVVIPGEPGWQTPGLATLTAQASQSGAAAMAFFAVQAGPEEATPGPTATPVITVVPSPAPDTPTATAQPGLPTATATANVNIRSGPGTAYPVLGMLRAGQDAPITGLSPDGGWWQIAFSGTADGRGWVSGSYVVAANTRNVAVVQPPARPTPIPTSPVIRDWRGEYYSNPNLSGAPALVRNDPAVNFDWGSGAPAAGLPADSFSVRWTRGLNFAAGSYRFYVRADDGVRLWVDGNLIVNEWHDSAPTLYSAEVWLSGADHWLNMEYYERSGGALAQLAWERVENYPDWKSEYYNNRRLEGNPVLVRNETRLDHDWGRGSPGVGVNADNFSARWTRRANFQDGTYLFRVWVDDGVRLWVDDTLLIDDWRDGGARWLEKQRQLGGGTHWVKLEYYEGGGDALIKLEWQRQEPANQPPQAVPGGPYSGDEGGLINLDGSRSSDPDGSVVGYQWDFDFDGWNFTPDAAGWTVAVRYPDGPATYLVALRVTDNRGASHTATTQVQVRNVAPTAEAGGPYAGQPGVPIRLAGSASDPSLADQNGLSYAWDFGDGTWGSGATPSHNFAQPGTYTAQLTVTDKDGGQGRDTASVVVTAVNQPPTAVISGPSQGQVGQTLVFDASGSSDVDGSIVDYTWEFGDGTLGSGISASHAYTQVGGYTLRLTVTDDQGLTDQAAVAVQVIATNQPPLALIQAPSGASPGQAVQFDASGSSDPDGNVVSYAWDFGDGATDRGVSVSHAYAWSGSYPVTLTVIDDDGAAGSATHTIHIAPPPSAN